MKKEHFRPLKKEPFRPLKKEPLRLLIKALFRPLIKGLKSDKKDLKESMRGSEFIFDSVDLLYYNLQKTSLNRKGSSYIDCKKLKN